jgi:integrase
MDDIWHNRPKSNREEGKIMRKAKVYRRSGRENRWKVVLWWKGKQYIRYHYDSEGTPLTDEILAKVLAEKINRDILRRKEAFNPELWFNGAKDYFAFEPYAERWFDRQTHYAPSVISDVKRYILKYAAPYFKNTDIREIRAAHIEDYLHSLPDKWSEKTKKNAMQYLHKLFSDALRREDIYRIPPFPVISCQEPEFKRISMDWQTKIIGAIPKRDRPIFIFMRSTGCRPGEARALKWDCVDFENKEIHLRRTFSGSVLRETTKARQNKPVPMTKGLEKMFKSRRGIGGFVFRTEKGKPYRKQRLDKLWNEARDKVGAPKVTLYQGTRHSTGTALLEQGWDMVAVQELLGHTRSDMTQRYAKYAKTNRLRKMLEEAGL